MSLLGAYTLSLIMSDSLLCNDIMILSQTVQLRKKFGCKNCDYFLIHQFKHDIVFWGAQ